MKELPKLADGDVVEIKHGYGVYGGCKGPIVSVQMVRLFNGDLVRIPREGLKIVRRKKFNRVSSKS